MTSSPFGLLQIQGPDASKFLQGQVTCDVAQTSISTGSYGAHCNPKGRVLFSFYLYRRADDCFWLQIPSSLLNQAYQDLKKYSVFSKVTLSILELPIKLIHSTQAISDRIIQDAAGIIRQRSQGYCEIIGQTSSLNLLDATDANVHWSLLDIQEGIAHIVAETREQFTPEEINFTLIDAVSFRKGCYTGQEIVARMHYKGKHKRHAHRMRVTSHEIPLPGSIILSGESEQKIGELICAVAINHTHQFECLVSIQDDARHHATLSINQEKMQWLSLPYAIPVTEDE